MANDVLALMRHLHHETFAVVGHDRGSYVAFRLAMDHPQAVSHLVVLDGVPIGDALRRCDAAFATAWWHWFFLGNPLSRAHEIISADAERWYETHGKQDHMGAESLADFREAVSDPATVLAMCEDYRAGLTVDRAHDEADREAGRHLQCPLLFIWAQHDDMVELYGDPVAVWRDWSAEVTGAAVDSGHHMAEEAPEELAGHLLRFLAKTTR
jgi:haloacetate dehalogenase